MLCFKDIADPAFRSRRTWRTPMITLFEPAVIAPMEWLKGAGEK